MTNEEAAEHLLTYSTTMGSGQTTDAQHNKAKRLAIKALKHEPKTGHWSIVSDGYRDGIYIFECSECKAAVWEFKDAGSEWNYCPNCGSRNAGKRGRNDNE